MVELLLHPGTETAIKRGNMDEQQLAEAIATGEIASPQKFANSDLFNIRITGTGKAFRAGLKEHVWRDPSLYINDHFLKRCNGLPVIVEHPPGLMLNSKEFSDRIIGTVILPYVPSDKPDEVWGIARILDHDAANYMREHDISTSPAVVFRDESDNETVDLDDGTHLLIEGKPALLDHVAICELGTWDREGPPKGVDVSDGDDSMSENRSDAKDDDKKRDDEAGAGEKLDKILAGLDSVHKRMDAVQADAQALKDRMDMYDDDKKRDDSRADAKKRRDEDPEHEKKQAEELEELAEEERKEAKEDSARKDDDDDDRKDSRRADRRRRDDDDDDKKRDDSKRADKRKRDDEEEDEEEKGETKEPEASTDKKRKDSRGKADDDDDDKKRDDSKPRADRRKRDDGMTARDRKDDDDDDDKKRDDAKEDDCRDDDDDDDKRKRDDARADSAPNRRLRALERRLDEEQRARRDLERRYQEPTPEDEALLAEAQSRADSVAMAFGEHAPRPLQGERVMPYRVRLARLYQKHSKLWADEDLSRLAKNTPKAFGNAESAIFNDAMQAARSPTDLAPGMLREVHRPRPGAPGMTLTEFVGPSTLTWMDHFMQPRRRFTKFNDPRTGR